MSESTQKMSLDLGTVLMYLEHQSQLRLLRSRPIDYLATVVSLVSNDALDCEMSEGVRRNTERDLRVRMAEFLRGNFTVEKRGKEHTEFRIELMVMTPDEFYRFVNEKAREIAYLRANSTRSK